MNPVLWKPVFSAEMKLAAIMRAAHSEKRLWARKDYFTYFDDALELYQITDIDLEHVSSISVHAKRHGVVKTETHKEFMAQDVERIWVPVDLLVIQYWPPALHPELNDLVQVALEVEKDLGDPTTLCEGIRAWESGTIKRSMWERARILASVLRMEDEESRETLLAARDMQGTNIPQVLRHLGIKLSKEDPIPLADPTHVFPGEVEEALFVYIAGGERFPFYRRECIFPGPRTSDDPELYAAQIVHDFLRFCCGPDSITLRKSDIHFRIVPRGNGAPCVSVFGDFACVPLELMPKA